MNLTTTQTPETFVHRYNEESVMASRKQIVLRVDPSINSAVRKAAKAAGLSINAYSEKVLGRAAGAKQVKK